uniref:Uncharacterized protein n=1 Tax=Arundo donax TaxID=35708 RepID=A0A0A9EN17_ARUDO
MPQLLSDPDLIMRPLRTTITKGKRAQRPTFLANCSTPPRLGQHKPPGGKG